MRISQTWGPYNCNLSRRTCTSNRDPWTQTIAIEIAMVWRAAIKRVENRTIMSNTFELGLFIEPSFQDDCIFVTINDY